MARPSDTSPVQGAFRDVMLITLVACILFLPSLATRDLWNPDEPRYMEVAREMVLLNDYLVPHLNGDQYPDKPPMFFWLAAGLYRAGVGYNAGRVIALLASLGTALLTYFLGRRFLSRQGGVFAALATLTAGLFLATSKMGVIDPLLAFFTTASIFSGLRAMDPEGRRACGWWLISYAAAALAVLTKGPVGLIVPAIVLVGGGYAWREGVRKGGWIHLAGGVLLLGIVAAWLVPALARGGEAYARNILFHQTAGRVWRSYSHRSPVYRYILESPWIFLPWTLFLVPAVWSAVRAWKRPDEAAARLGLIWFGTAFLFFALISGKRPGYLMPLMPAFGLLMGRHFALANRAEHLWPRAHKVLVVITLAFAFAGLLAAVPAVGLAGWICQLVYPGDGALAQDVMDAMKGSLPWVIAFTLTGTVVVLVGWRATCRRNRAGAFVPTMVLLMALSSLFADIIVMPRANLFKSGRGLVRAGREYINDADSLFFYHKAYDGAYNLYTGRLAIPVLKDPEELEAALAASEKVAVIAHERHIAGALGSSARVGYVAAGKRVGHRKMLLVTNWKNEEHAQ